MITKIIAAIVVVAALAAGGYIYWRYSARPVYAYRTEPVKRADLIPTISATGTVEPEATVDVGTQVGGLVVSLGNDVEGHQVDYHSEIEAGTVLAHIDDTLYLADAATAEAQTAQAKAGLLRAQADLGQMKAKLEQAASDWQRAQKLGTSDALSQSDYETSRATFEAAQANVAVGEAAISQAAATVAQSEAAAQRSKHNVQYCTITSPVKGVIIDRRVNVGQTVNSSLSAPSLFLIAKDLTRIQVWVAVNEADIGNIYPDQPVTFTVDAFPGRTFKGKVGKLRLNAQMTQNVVTYTVEVLTDNSDGKLLPYLTANVQFETAHRTNVLQVPNAALRWYPQTEMVAPDVRQAVAAAPRGGGQGGAATQPGDGGAATTKPARADRGGLGAERRGGAAGGRGTGHGHGTLWIVDGEYVRPIKVRSGATDNLMTEVEPEGGELKEGAEVVVGQQRQQAADANNGTTNPFAPQVFRGGGRRQ